ncbi:galectin 17 [Nelusetta ayraudi]|uniref:galectin 17 n=1 Tax=Nelusetta ayraudi TaxID=303726 RepID=UPI003F70C7CA
MKAARSLSRIIMALLLICRLFDSSPLSQSIQSKVGHRTVLPCDWRPRLQVALPSCHVQWLHQVDTVLEHWGHSKYQAPEYQKRLEVREEEKLEAGDCSLIINDVQMGDAGRYESFMVVDRAPSEKTRVFIHSVRLLVFDHKSQEVRAPGENLELQLYTRHSVRVIFQSSRNSSQWTNLWVRPGEEEETEQQQYQHRVVKDPLKEQLTIRRLMEDDEGTYKVLDLQGLAISTTQLSVKERSGGERRAAMVSPGDAVSSSSSSHWALLNLPLFTVVLRALLLHLLIQ